MMGYKIGLDIGISSIGYAVLETDELGNPFKIKHINSVIFTPAEQPKTGASLAEPRREKRGGRRRTRRTHFRKYRTKRLFEESRLLTMSEMNQLTNPITGSEAQESIYELRVKALDEKVSVEEMFRLLYYFVGHRGFKSNRKAELTDKDNGPVLTAIKKMEVILEEGKYRTIGEYILNDEKYKDQKRNKSDNFIGTVQREMLIHEIELIFERQKELGNDVYTEAFIKKYVDVSNQTAIFNGQRDFDEGPGAGPYSGNQIEKMIGYCTFEPKERRAAKGTYTFQLFNLLTKINNLKIKETVGDQYRSLRVDERELLREKAFSTAGIKYSQIKKWLDLTEATRFNLLNYGSKKTQEQTEKSDFIVLTSYKKIEKALPKEVFDALTVGQLDEIGRILSAFSGDTSRIREFGDCLTLSEDTIEALLPVDMSGFGSLSLVAMKKIIPFLEAGNTYDKSCDAAGYDFRQNKINLEYIHNNVANPVVKRSVMQTIKVVNQIVRKYGKPDSITIELARDLGRNFEERKKMTKRQEENMARNERIANEIRELRLASVNGENITRYKLWQDQKNIDLYTGKHIPIEKLFSYEYDVDHIIPYSISFDDSLGNKVVVSAKANREKGNRIPMEYFGNDSEKVKYFKENVSKLGNFRKREKLLKISLSDEDRDEWKSRNLNDTRYISKLLKGYFSSGAIEFSEHVSKKLRVEAVTGGVTAKIRARWGFNKIRSASDKHHALDAIVIACITPKYVKEVTNFSRRKEIKDNSDLWKSKELLEELELEVAKTKKDYDRIFQKAFPLPWDGFREEVIARMSESTEEFKYWLLDRGELTTYTNEEIENFEPMFVVRKPNRKVTGAAHLDTIRSGKLLKEGKTISRVTIDKLKLNKQGDIVSGNSAFYKTIDNGWKIVYDALKDKLEKHEGDGTKAFPTKSLTFSYNGQTHTVRRVRVVGKATLQVPLDRIKDSKEHRSAADNGSMVRIDVFRVEGKNDKWKYMFVPIYVADTVEEKLPNKACIAHKPYFDWPEMKEEDFIFSLYQNDLIHLIHFNGIKPYYNIEPKNETDPIKDFYGYYDGANIAIAGIQIKSHDNSFWKDSIGIVGLPMLEKYQVDYFGNYHKVKKEKRQHFK